MTKDSLSGERARREVEKGGNPRRGGVWGSQGGGGVWSGEEGGGV